jgi:hypothetical protein
MLRQLLLHAIKELRNNLQFVAARRNALIVACEREIDDLRTGVARMTPEQIHLNRI